MNCVENATIYQTLPWGHRGWHCGGSSNNGYIGAEMCEPGCVKYTSGSKFTCSDLPTVQAVVTRIYYAAAGLFADLCEKYGLDLTGYGVILMSYIVIIKIAAYVRNRFLSYLPFAVFHLFCE